MKTLLTHAYECRFFLGLDLYVNLTKVERTELSSHGVLMYVSLAIITITIHRAKLSRGGSSPSFMALPPPSPFKLCMLHTHN